VTSDEAEHTLLVEDVMDGLPIRDRAAVAAALADFLLACFDAAPERPLSTLDSTEAWR
jgi:hypothetical protein